MLAVKAEMGHRLHEAYHANDRATVKTIAEEQIPEMIKRIKAFRAALRKQRMAESKDFGFDILAVRIGGLISMAEQNQETLLEWLNGTRSQIDELEAPRIPYLPIPENGDPYLLQNRWLRIVGQNMANMFGVKA